MKRHNARNMINLDFISVEEFPVTVFRRSDMRKDVMATTFQLSQFCVGIRRGDCASLVSSKSSGTAPVRIRRERQRYPQDSWPASALQLRKKSDRQAARHRGREPKRGRRDLSQGRLGQSQLSYVALFRISESPTTSLL